ncbi:MAG: hypothetical protein N2572_09275 [Syntrophales bacterium]|nr:hypothetical protein [Syntrophales bacterium]
MGERVTLDDLKEIADRLGIEVRLEPLTIEGTIHVGGYCLVKGKPVVILNKKSSRIEQIKTLGEAIKKHDLSGLYLRPAIRRYLGLEETL